MSSIVNKVKDALHSDKAHEQPEGTHGPHGSRVANAADPRVDSDRDHRANPATTTTHGSGLTGTGVTGTGLTGATSGATSGVTGYDDPQGTHGPHGSRIANTADPLVDSDRDHRGAPGHTTAGTGGFSSTGGTAGGLGSAGGATAGGLGSTGAGTTGYDDPAGTHGPHGSRVANVADPRVDSDRDNRSAPGAAGTAFASSGPGPAPNTAGPHKSDVLNKADPRVDSDLDGSKTVGGNKTFQSGGSGSAVHKDPTDAAQVPPSVLRQHIGDPTIEHGDLTYGREERHQSISHQDAHRGI